MTSYNIVIIIAITSISTITMNMITGSPAPTSEGTRAGLTKWERALNI